MNNQSIYKISSENEYPNIIGYLLIFVNKGGYLMNLVNFIISNLITSKIATHIFLKRKEYMPLSQILRQICNFKANLIILQTQWTCIKIKIATHAE